MMVMIHLSLLLQGITLRQKCFPMIPAPSVKLLQIAALPKAMVSRQSCSVCTLARMITFIISSFSDYTCFTSQASLSFISVVGDYCS